MSSSEFWHLINNIWLIGWLINWNLQTSVRYIVYGCWKPLTLESCHHLQSEELQGCYHETRLSQASRFHALYTLQNDAKCCSTVFWHWTCRVMRSFPSPGWMVWRWLQGPSGQRNFLDSSQQVLWHVFLHMNPSACTLPEHTIARTWAEGSW